MDSAVRCFLAQPEMRSILVVVADIFVEKAFQMPFVEHNHMIQQVAAATFHPTLGDSVLPGALERSSLGFARHCSDGGNYFQSELLVPVKDQVFVRGSYGNASRNCCTTQWLSGLRVTLR